MQKTGAAATRLHLVTLMVTALILGGCSSTESSSSTGSMNSAPLTQSGRSPISASSVGAATLTWVAPTENTNGTPLTDLAGYRIRYGTSPDALSQSIDLAGTNTTSYEISGLAPGTYYFAVSAYTAMGSESAPSDVGAKTI